MGTGCWAIGAGRSVTASGMEAMAVFFFGIMTTGGDDEDVMLICCSCSGLFLFSMVRVLWGRTDLGSVRDIGIGGVDVVQMGAGEEDDAVVEIDMELPLLEICWCWWWCEEEEEEEVLP